MLNEMQTENDDAGAETIWVESITNHLGIVMDISQPFQRLLIKNHNEILDKNASSSSSNVQSESKKFDQAPSPCRRWDTL